MFGTDSEPMGRCVDRVLTFANNKIGEVMGSFNAFAVCFCAVFLLTACGGGGGGSGGGDDSDNTSDSPSVRQVTPMPDFMGGNEANCELVLDGVTYKPQEFTGTLASVSELHCAGGRFYTLSGIEQFSGLTSLELQTATLSDIGPIANLRTLQHLNLADNRISDISPLYGLSNLQTLNLTNNRIFSVSILATLTNLNLLKLDGNSGLGCLDVAQLEDSLGEQVRVVRPAHCGRALLLKAESPTTTTIDNCAESEPYDRVIFFRDLVLVNFRMFQRNGNLHLELNDSTPLRSLTFLNWFDGVACQVNVFEFSTGTQRTFEQLHDIYGLRIELTEMDDVYVGSAGRDIVSALNGVDRIDGGAGSDILLGGEGEDRLSGGEGADRLVGGSAEIAGSGSVGNMVADGAVDTYVYERQGGKDTLYDYETDRAAAGILQFDDSISSADINLERSSSDLILKIDEQNSVTINRWYATNTEAYRIGFFQFGDNVPVVATDWVSSRTVILRGSGYIEGSTGADNIVGGNFNDRIEGRSGADVITGGRGDDVLAGSYVSFLAGGEILIGWDDQQDRFFYNAGDGNDVIYDRELSGLYRGLLSFGSDITEDDPLLFRDGADLVFYFDDNNSVSLFNWYDTSTLSIGQIQFAGQEAENLVDWISRYNKPYEIDGAGVLRGSLGPDVITGGDSDDILYGDVGEDRILGGAGNDYLFGGPGIDTLDGGTGNDMLYGNTGELVDGVVTGTRSSAEATRYIYGLNSGHDRVYDYQSTFSSSTTLQLDGSLSTSDFIMFRADYDLKLQLDADNSVTLVDWFRVANGRLDGIQFGAAAPVSLREWHDHYSNINTAEIEGTYYGSIGVDRLVGSAGSDFVYGGNGDDRLEGAGGDDELRGEAGQDNLMGAVGNDKLWGGPGNDVLEGGAGDDLLIGGYALFANDGSLLPVNGSYGGQHVQSDSAADIYVFNIGDGRDVIYDYEAGVGFGGTLMLGPGISADDVVLTRTADDLVLQFDAANSVSLFNWFHAPAFRIAHIQFDGQAPIGMEEWLATRQLVFAAGASNGTAYRDLFQGGSDSDVFSGSGGSDTLYGNGGNDHLAGAYIFFWGGVLQNKAYEGDGAQDIYHFNRGDGHDVIYDYEQIQANRGLLVLGSDISENDIELHLQGDDLILQIDEANSITWNQWRRSTTSSFNGAVTQNGILTLGQIQFGEQAPVDGTTWILARPITLAANTVHGTPATDILVATEAADTFYGYQGNDRIQGLGGDDALDGGFGDDEMDGGTGNDTLTGGDGADHLFGGEDHDTLRGGYGVDELVGGPGDDLLGGREFVYSQSDGHWSISYDGSVDTYVYNLGDGNDRLFERERVAEYRGILKFGPGISSSSITLHRNGNDLTMGIGPRHSVTLTQWYSDIYGEGTTYRIGWIQFDDGALLLAEEWIAARSVTEGPAGYIEGNAGADQIEGSAGPERLEGLGGDDRISGGNGADVIRGGAGNDILSGSRFQFLADGSVEIATDYAVDTYLYARGDGRDLIYDRDDTFDFPSILIFAEGIAEEDVHLYRSGNNLIFELDAGNAVTWYNWFAASANRTLRIRFGSGALLNAETWVSGKGYTVRNETVPGRTMTGNAGNNTMVGSDGNDVMNGMAGDDDLIGGAGSDTLHGGADDDYLFGGHANVSGDTVSWGSGTSYYDHAIDTYLYNLGDGHDHIVDYDAEGYHGILKFGATINPASIRLQRGRTNTSDLFFYIDYDNEVSIDSWFEGEGVKWLQFGNNAPVDAATWVQSRTIEVVSYR